jgi:uncharacterized LabA/DUF88 family protein
MRKKTNSKHPQNPNTPNPNPPQNQKPKSQPQQAQPQGDKHHEADRQKQLVFQKVAIFVDAENIEMSGLKYHEGRSDYKKILSKVGDREITRILYYKPVYKEISDSFTAFWSSLGGEIRRPQKNADSFLIIDAVTLADKVDVAIILGGDKDFLPLMWYLKSRGCRVEIWSWPESTSPEVKENCDFYFPLTSDYVIKDKKT